MSFTIIDNIKYLIIESPDIKNIYIEELSELLAPVDECNGITLSFGAGIDNTILDAVKRHNISSNSLGFRCYSLSNAFYILDCVISTASSCKKCPVLQGISAVSQMICDSGILIMRVK